MAVTLTGPGGDVRWSYLTAATVGPWTIAADAAGGTLTATVLSADPYRLWQTGLEFRCVRPSGTVWRWPVLTLSIADDATLTASVGPQKE